ncbi:MAG: glycosyltransferase family 1 protein, partial [Candidatus Viridilinea halotolerans]
MISSSGVRILFDGEYWPGSNTIYIANAFEHYGAIVRFFCQGKIFPEWNSRRGKIARRLLSRFIVEYEWNHQLLKLVATFRPDLVYITKGSFIWRSTIAKIKRMGALIMCFYHDIPWKTQDPRFNASIADFDLVATTRQWHKVEFERAGAKAVCVVRFGFEPAVHRPVRLSARDMEMYAADLTFIGSPHPYRITQFEQLVQPPFPYTLRIWGDGWAQAQQLLPYWQQRRVEEQELPLVYAGSKVALHWVHWEPNSSDQALQRGDQHNSRTFQIAACGTAMMLAQRTDEHQRFFTEDVEAVYFTSLDELREKIAYWLHPARDTER